MSQRTWARGLTLPAIITTLVIALAACGQITTPTTTHPQAPTLVSPQATADWQLNTVSTPGVALNTVYDYHAEYTSVALDNDGNPDVAYAFVEQTSSDYSTRTVHVMYASYDTSATTPQWTSQEVTGLEPNDGLSLAFDDTNTPHIVWATSNALYYASPDTDSSTGWGTPTSVTVSGNYISGPRLAFDSSGNPHIAYISCTYAGPSCALKYASHDSNGWNSDTVISAVAKQWYFPPLSLVFDQGNPHISAHGWNSDTSTGTLVYSSFDPSDDPQWTTVVMDNSAVIANAMVNGLPTSTVTFTDFGAGNSLAFDSNHNPHISFLGCDHPVGGGQQWCALMYASPNNEPSSDWSATVIDDGNGNGIGNPTFDALVFDSDWTPHISYLAQDQTNWSHALKYASDSGSGWQVDTVNTMTASMTYSNPFFASLAFDHSDDQPYVSYMESDSYDIMLASGALSPGTAISNLLTYVEGLAPETLKTGQANGLAHPLKNALRSWTNGHIDDAYNQLQDFISDVQAKTPTPLKTEIADGLISTAENIESSLGY